MSAANIPLDGFVYGEHLEGPQRRSLGFRLLAPAAAAPWSAEVEALARHLQAAPYPEHWPPSDLLCSVLLADGRRLVALARYGLADHTPSQRRGGLELVGVVGPGDLGVPAALAVYRWLRQRRQQTDEPRGLAGQFRLADVLAASPPPPPDKDAVPVLPIRLWQEGTLLFAALAPSDPDHHLRLLEEGTAAAWQWLPLVGGDFPLQTYAQRGPLVAWTPHLAEVAVKLDRRPPDGGPVATVGRSAAGWALGGVLLVLLVANLWVSLAAYRRPLPELPAAVPAGPDPSPRAPVTATDPAREQLGRALYRVLQRQAAPAEWDQGQLLRHYERLAAADESLRLNDPEGKAALGLASLLSRRSAGQIEQAVREALADKGYDPRLVDLACQRVRQHLADARESP